MTHFHSSLSRGIAFFLALISLSIGEATLPDINEHDVKVKLNEIMQYHASHKEISPQIIKRALNNFINELDPAKTYFIESDIINWTSPSDELIATIQKEHHTECYRVYEKIYDKMVEAIHRRHELEKFIDKDNLPSKVRSEEFKDMDWSKNDQELLTRLMRLRSLQIDTARKLNDDMEGRVLARIAKRQAKYEEEILTTDPENRKKQIFSNVLKAYASALDSHTSYFTPDEASQFLISVQQRLFGIGAALRDDLNGFTVVKIVEGGPAYRGKELKAKDRIVAINGEPVVGMDITDAVEIIRGPENTPVDLTVVRESQEGDQTHEETLNITIMRGEVVIKEARYESEIEPFGNGVIVHLKLFTFYQDRGSSSTEDLRKEIERIKKEHHVLGIVLDLRNNTGGLLTQAVGVTGLFITKGVVVSIKDEKGQLQHLRDVDGKTTWDGPLMVLINRASASASEIVAQTLQDYGRALIVGDDTSYGKGSFQIFTLSSGTGKPDVNPKGEYKVTRGRYYTVSGKSPQLVGVESDIVVPGIFSESEIGEKYAKYPLENDQIKPHFDDDLSDVPFFQRSKVQALYKFNLQKPLDLYKPYLQTLGRNSAKRIETNEKYQGFLKELKKKDAEIEEEEDTKFSLQDFQLQESFSIMKDLILLMTLQEEEEALSHLNLQAS